MARRVPKREALSGQGRLATSNCFRAIVMALYISNSAQAWMLAIDSVTKRRQNAYGSRDVVTRHAILVPVGAFRGIEGIDR
jgi:hypothetical protein